MLAEVVDGDREPGIAVLGAPGGSTFEILLAVVVGLPAVGQRDPERPFVLVVQIANVEDEAAADRLVGVLGEEIADVAAEDDRAGARPPATSKASVSTM